ncbi:hypothetical protein Pth03_11410 [Planotetraspora thailandica]|uniref:Uncharacterized protein n=1 Tax=Planotetraspora thailandica TaxID=487172 RepID=A0A8J3UZJ6_9ACTN|nr:hypothetical protein [Planotetraspora thailandica]GII52752.1 hypothetical protein Pth03_11410 [Planotetraspora thailandica]
MRMASWSSFRHPPEGSTFLLPDVNAGVVGVGTDVESALDDLVAARRSRWWCDGPPLRDIEEAKEFVEDVGFCLLFGGREARYPSLREASRDDSRPRLPSGWGDDLEAMWTWKDELPVRGEAWLGKYLSGKQTLIAPGLLADLYEYAGVPEDFHAAHDLGPVAVKVATHLLHEGPTPTRTLRAIFGESAKTVDKAVADLGRKLLVTNYGVEETGSGWASCVLELTARAFTVPSQGSRAERDAGAAACFLDTMITTRPGDLRRAFGWPRERADAALPALSREAPRATPSAARAPGRSG